MVSAGAVVGAKRCGYALTMPAFFFLAFSAAWAQTTLEGAQIEVYRAGTLAWMERGLTAQDFATGSDLFDQEWAYGSWMMAAMGFGQHALAHPDQRTVDLSHMEAAIDVLLRSEGRTFDRMRWQIDPMDALMDLRGHAAWLGYTALPIGLHRLLVADSRYAEVGDRLVAAIVRRLQTEPTLLVETYPGERFPVDNAAMIGALGLHTRVTGEDHTAAVQPWLEAAQVGWREPETGLLRQAIGPNGQEGPGRGSGTFLAAWFLSFSAEGAALGAQLYQAGASLQGSLLGYTMMREYPRGIDGPPDIDSGPIVLGFGVSATGFAMGAAGASGDLRSQQALARTARDMAQIVLALEPSLRGPAVGAGSGSAIGDGILFAMATARPLPEPPPAPTLTPR